MADIRLRLVADSGQPPAEAPLQPGEQPGEQAAQQPGQQQQQQQHGEQQQPGEQQQHQPSPSPAPEEQAVLAGGGSRGPRRGKSKSRDASQPTAAGRGAAGRCVSAEGAGSSRGGAGGRGRGRGGTKQAAKSRSASAATPAVPPGPPRGVRIEVLLTDELQRQLWWDAEDGDLSAQMEGDKKGKGRSGRGTNTKWTKTGAALGRVVAALLQHGQGLALGPDSDGLLNLGDVPHQEWREAAAPARHAMFDVDRLLDSGAWAWTAAGRVWACGSQRRQQQRATAANASSECHRVPAPPAPTAAVAYKHNSAAALPPPGGLATAPKTYQLTGLQWMLDREVKVRGRWAVGLRGQW